MKAQTQELIQRNLARITAEGGKLAAMWDTLDTKAQRRWVSTWSRLEREAASEASEREYMNSDGPAHRMGTL